MAMAKCKECGGDIRAKAAKCPHCGIRLGMHPFLKVVISLVGVYLFLVAISMAFGPDKPASPSQESVSATEPASAEKKVDADSEQAAGVKPEYIKSIQLMDQGRNSRSVYVVLNRRLSSDELGAALDHIHNTSAKFKGASRYSIYLDGCTDDVNGMWAWAEIEGGTLKNVMHGIFLEDVPAWKNMPQVKADEILGQWLEDCQAVQQRRTLVREGKNYFLIADSAKHSAVDKVQIQKLSERRYKSMQDPLVYEIGKTGMLRVVTADGQPYSEWYLPIDKIL